MEYSIQDIIDAAVENEPTKMQAAFDQLIGPKIMDALESRKKDIASNMFRSQQDTEELDTTVEVEDENTEPAQEEN